MNAHPRLLSDTDFALKVSASPALWRNVIRCAENPTPTEKLTREHLICRAVLYRFGLLPGFTYAWDRDEYGLKAILDAALLASPIKNPVATWDSDFTSGGIDVGFVFDWCYDLLPADGKAILRDLIEAQLALQAPDYWKNNPTPWVSKNQMCGCGLALALAIDGDATQDWVTQYQTWMNLVGAPVWNSRWVSQFLGGGGDPEGTAYFSRELHPIVVDACHKSATGASWAWGRFLDDMPLFMLNATWRDNAPGKPDRWLPFSGYSANMANQSNLYAMMHSWTGNSDPDKAALARWLIDRTTGWGKSLTPASGLIFGLLIGDPHVTGKSPTELNLPLTYDMPGWGPHFSRSSWDSSATVVCAGVGTTFHRARCVGDVMVCRGGQIVTANRNNIVDHSYAPMVLNNVPLLYDASGDLACCPGSNNGKPEWMERAYAKRNGNTLFCEMDQVYVDGDQFGKMQPKSTRVETCHREVTYGGDRVVTVSDYMEFDPSLTLHQVWNTPTVPSQIDDYTVKTQNGVWQFDRPCNVIVTGGLDHLCDDLHGTSYSAKPGWTGFAKFNSFLNAPQFDQFRLGGFWRFHVVPRNQADGKIGLVTRIEAI